MIRLAAALLLAAAPALADCPTGDALAGKALRLSGAGTVETHRPMDGNTVETLATFSDQPPWRQIARYGLYPVEGRDFFGSGDDLVTTYRSMPPLATLPEPSPGVQVELVLTSVSGFDVSTEDGKTEVTDVLAFRFEPPVTLQLAGCAYTAIPVIETRNGESRDSLVHHYIPGFGLALLTGPLDATGNPTMAHYDRLEVVE